MPRTDVSVAAAKACGFAEKDKTTCGLFTTFRNRDNSIDLTLRSSCEMNATQHAKYDTQSPNVTPEMKDLMFCINKEIVGRGKVYDHSETFGAIDKVLGNTYVKFRRFE